MTDAPTNAELAERLEADVDSLRGDAYNSVDRAFKQWANSRASLISLAAERLRGQDQMRHVLAGAMALFRDAQQWPLNEATRCAVDWWIGEARAALKEQT